MIVQLDTNSKKEEIEALCGLLVEYGAEVTHVRTQRGAYLIALNHKELDIRRVGQCSGVLDVHVVTDAFKLVSRKWKAAPTEVVIDETASIKEGQLTIIAGPCSIESREQVASVASFLQSQGVRFMRGGVFKPRTSPYAFRGLGFEGLRFFREIADEFGLKIVTEVVSASHVAEMFDYVDVFQVGTRNTQNFDLLSELGKVDKPVLLKRGMSGTIDELLQSAEYVFSSGNEKLLLCERGIRTYEKAYRNTLDLNAVPLLKEKSHLPVIVDPSHGIGIRRFVEPMVYAAAACGADGIMIEMHPNPPQALSDGQQSLDFDETERVLQGLKRFTK